MMQADTLTLIIAVYGAILSTFIIIWRLYEWFHQTKPRLRIKINLGLIAQGKSVSSEQIIVDASNIGEVVITVVETSFVLPGYKLIVRHTSPPLPAELREGKKITFWVEIEEFKKRIRQHRIPKGEIKAYVRDATDHTYQKKLPSAIVNFLY